MKNCPACKEGIIEKTDFCVSCGASLKRTRTEKQMVNNQQTEKQPVKKGKSYILLALLVVLIAFMFTGYQLLSNKFSEEVVIEQFKTALLNEDKVSLIEIIQPNDPRMEINADSLEALFVLIDNERSIVHDMIDKLSDYNVTPFSLKKDGKHYGIFDRYVISAQDYYLVLSNVSNEMTTIYVNDEKVTVLEGDEDFKEIGPYLAGSYLIKAKSDENGHPGEDMTNVKVIGMESKLEVVLDTEVFEEYEGNDEEMFQWTEEDDNFYILPDSSSTYLRVGDINMLNPTELRIARNEIFARHGYIFDSKDLQNYFASLSWYSPNVNYDGYLSDIEKSNIELIKSLE